MTGTVPNNYPPGFMEVGYPIITASIVGATGPLPLMVLFTAPVAGLYQMGPILHVTQTDGAGSLVLTLRNFPGFNVDLAIQAPVTRDAVVGNKMCWMNQGTQITGDVNTVGTGSTTFDVYLSVVRVF